MVPEKESILSTSCLIYLGITQHLFKEEYENTKSVNRSKMDNAMTKSKRTKEQIMIYKTQRKKDRVTLTTLATGGEFGCSTRVTNCCSTSVTGRVTLVTKTNIG